MPSLVKSIKHLKELCDDNPTDCFIALNGGVKSSKTITYYNDQNIFFILNSIDDTEQTLTPRDLRTNTLIAEAIDKRAFYYYD